MKKSSRHRPGHVAKGDVPGRPHDKPHTLPHDNPHKTDGKPRRPAHPRGPRHPPVLVFPGLTTEQAEVLQSLPRRVQQPPQGRPLPQRVAREILVLVNQSRPQSLAGELARAYGLELVSSRPVALLGARAELFRLRAGRSETAALAALRGDPRVRSAQFNWRYFHTADGQRETVAIPQYGPRNVHLQEAHRLALGRRVTIAVIDSAVDTTHPDLEGAVVSSFDVVADADATPDFHGTAVAGIIRSRGVVEGVAPQAGIMAVRAFRTKPGALPETTTELLLGAIDWAVGNGAKVLNMSFVGPRSGQLEELLQAASRKGIVLVAAAGNAWPKAPPAYPAAFPGVIAVTAVDAADRRYQHANRGRYIAIAAPGVDVLAPVEGGKYELLSGTSFATAYVSGIAALLLERDPTLDAATVARLIAAGADDLGPAGRDDDFGAGRINALAALKSMHEVATRTAD
jgi:subtilisin family serine protease